MIYYIKGILQEKTPSGITVEAGGMGYRINVPFSLLDSLPKPGQKTKIYTYLHTRENALELYGFPHPEQREFFITLISLASIGPRSALRMLNKVTPWQFKKAIARKDLTQLMKTPGIGRKTAQRLILELEGVIKEEEEPSPEDQTYQDGINALISLGYSKSKAKKAINKSLQKNGSFKQDLTELIKEALSYV